MFDPVTKVVDILSERVQKDPVAALTGLCKGDSSLTKALLQARKDDRNLEAKKFVRFLRDADVA